MNLEELANILERQDPRTLLLIDSPKMARGPILTYLPSPAQVAMVDPGTKHSRYLRMSFSADDPDPVWIGLEEKSMAPLELAMASPFLLFRTHKEGYSLQITPPEKVYVGSNEIFAEIKRRYEGVVRDAFLEVTRTYNAFLEGP